MLAGWLHDPRLSGAGAAVDGKGLMAAHDTSASMASDFSALWTTAEPLAAPMTDQQVFYACVKMSAERTMHATSSDIPFVGSELPKHRWWWPMPTGLC